MEFDNFNIHTNGRVDQMLDLDGSNWIREIPIVLKSDGDKDSTITMVYMESTRSLEYHVKGCAEILGVEKIDSNKYGTDYTYSGGGGFDKSNVILTIFPLLYRNRKSVEKITLHL